MRWRCRSPARIHSARVGGSTHAATLGFAAVMVAVDDGLTFTARKAELPGGSCGVVAPGHAAWADAPGARRTLSGKRAERQRRGAEREVRVSDETPVPGELYVGDHPAGYRRDEIIAANLGISNVRLALAGRPARTGVRKPGGTPGQFALEPGGTKLLVVNADSGQAPAYQIARLP